MKKISIVLLVATAGVYYYAFNSKVTTRRLTADFENIYSKESMDKLRLFISAYKDLDDTSEFYKRLKKNFKFVKRIEWDFSDPRTIHLKVVGVKPFMVVNDEFVLGDKKRIFAAFEFKGFGLDKLPKITVSQDHLRDKMDDLLYQFLKTIPPNLLTRYNVIYKSKHEILLQEKTYTILADESSVFSADKLNKVESIENGNFFDVRFKNRIIAQSHRRVKS